VRVIVEAKGARRMCRMGRLVVGERVRRLSRSRIPWWFVVALALGWPPIPAQGQGVRELALVCGEGSEATLSWCQETALAAQAAQGGLGLAASGGSDMPGSASTLGWRYPRSPKYSVSARTSFSRISMPSLGGGEALPRGDASFTFPAAHLSGFVGVFNGFSPAPNVGGVLSLDLNGSAHLVRVPKGRGFRNNLLGLGMGARLGILRESFNLPGISLSAHHRSLGRSGFGSLEEGSPAEARFHVSVSSLRGVVGKDVGGVGLFGGTGWERYRGHVMIGVTDWRPGSPGEPVESSAKGRLSSHRRLHFLGASLTYVILQVSGEGGWAQGFGTELGDRVGGDFDPHASSWFGSLALRVTF
jgi:hypothetical protein